MKPLRTAVLGCGGFAQRHAQNILALPESAQLVAFCDIAEDKARAYADKFSNGRGKTYTDHHEMIEKEALDLMVVCLPPFAHTDEVACAARHGVHLLMEKPIALTTEHAWQMVAEAEKAKIKTQVGFMFRFGEAIEQLKAYIASGEAGKVGLMSARYFCNSLHADWWRKHDKSGGQLVEQIIHMVDLMRYLLGEPRSVFSRQENLFHQNVPDYSIEDVSATVVSFEGGALGVIYATNGAIPNRWINDYHLVSQYITADFTNANNAVFHFTGRADVPSQTIASERNVHLSELLNLIQAIQTGNETRTPLREGALSLELALAARQSAEERREIWLPPQT